MERRSAQEWVWSCFVDKNREDSNNACSYAPAHKDLNFESCRFLIRIRLTNKSETCETETYENETSAK